MNVYLPKSITHFTPKYNVFSTWVDHLPFAYDLIDAIKPAVVVELGTQHGMSFFGFCQAQHEQNPAGKCFAIDTWEGDEHTGAYGQEFYNDVKQHAEENYPNQVVLLKMYFNEAVNLFENESIDILHIDGLHTYDAVKEDYETWIDKVRPGGIILFHDIKAKFAGFGAWKFWEELSRNNKIFTFNHGFGLGVLQKEGQETPQPKFIECLFQQDKSKQNEIRNFYTFAAKFHELKRKKQSNNIRL